MTIGLLVYGVHKVSQKPALALQIQTYAPITIRFLSALFSTQYAKLSATSMDGA
jgi:hypothetical protein